MLASWKLYFDASSAVFVYAPSKNHSLLFEGGKLSTGTLGSIVRHIPVNVRRPTFKEAQRIYRLLTQVADEQIEEKSEKANSPMNPEAAVPGEFEKHLPILETDLHAAAKSVSQKEQALENTPPVQDTELHEAAKSNDVVKTLELLERGVDPCVRDSRGRTPYMLASEKEVRNTFRRFMAVNPDKWDWRAAGVPSALTKEMEESQAAKQVSRFCLSS